MTWAQRLKRVFRIEIERCERCGGRVTILASVEDAAVAGRILAYVEQGVVRSAVLTLAHPARGPPGQGELDFG